MDRTRNEVLGLVGGVAAAVVALVVGAVLGIRFYSQDAPAYTGRITTPSASATPTRTTTRPPKVLVLGDSYAAGTGATGGQGWVALVGDALGWDVTNDARGGTGYLMTAGRTGCGLEMCPNFDQMIPTAKDDMRRPDIVLVSGGRNDTSLPPAAERAGVAKFYRDLRAEFPHAEIYAMSPLWDSTTPAPALAQIKARVEEAVGAAGGTFVDLGQPLAGRPSLISADKVHPNDVGHEAIARAVLAQIGNE